MEEEIIKTIQYIKPKGLDNLGICSAIYHKYPQKSQAYEDKWQEVFKDITIYLDVNSIVNRTYNFNQPATYSEKDKEK